MRTSWAKLYIPGTLNIDLILWHTQLIVYGNHGLNLLFISLSQNWPPLIGLYLIGLSLSLYIVCLEEARQEDSKRKDNTERPTKKEAENFFSSIMASFL